MTLVAKGWVWLVVGVVLLTAGVGSPGLAQVFVQPYLQPYLRGANTFSQSINSTFSAEDPLIGQFIQSWGAQAISATVRSDVKATAYLDVTGNELDDYSTVFGVASVELQPDQAQLIALPAPLLNLKAVRLRVVNRDRSFGRVWATISVTR